MSSLEGKVALVTGAERGIGRSIALALAKEGASIALHYALDEQSALSVAEEIRPMADVRVYHADFANPKIDLVQRVVADFGRIDILVNNAGVMAPTSIHDISMEQLHELFQINTFVPMILSRDAFAVMKDREGGRIINISSFTIRFGMGRNASIHYAASKASLETMTTGMSRLGADHKILVNAIRPGVTATGMQKDRKGMEGRIAMIPLKRMAQPEEIAAAVMYFAGPSGAFTTGQILSVAGGE
jgi:NAD(P)-dependent dehydrogenase (short-subunit alcohol dehydrogenase family)